MLYSDPNTYTIPDGNLPDFLAAIAKLNRKAVKLGVAPVEVEKVAYIMVKKQREPEEGALRGKFYHVPCTIIAIEGKAPQVEGFEFLARIEYLSDGKSTLFHTVPGMSAKVDERFRSLKSAVCEHCNSLRQRRDVFVVRNIATGEQKQVGRQCLADYTGIHTVENLAARASWASQIAKIISEIDGYWSAGGFFADKRDTARMLALTSAYIEAYGWTPKSACMGDPSKTATANYVTAHYAGRSCLTSEERHSLEKFDDKANESKHVERAAAVIEWIKTDLAKRAKSDYELNLVTLVANELTESKHAGIVCSAVAAWQRAMNQQVEYSKRKDEQKNSKPVGSVGQRLRDIPVKVLFVRSSEGFYGPTTLVKFLTQDGNVLTWFATGDRDYEVNEELKITATVKGHKEYNGIIETQVNRVA